MTGDRALPEFLLHPIVRSALEEDLAPCGDVTTRAVIPAGATHDACIRAREPGTVSGMQVAALAFRMLDPALRVEIRVPDGNVCAAGEALLAVSGSAASILAAERVALNLAARLCGIATLTARFVAETRGTGARITCTRKTTPGLRLVEKQAVLHGGGSNHRFGLSDAILIKDNHIAAAGGVEQALRAARTHASHMLRVEIEVDRLDQLATVLAVGGADVVMLDNMEAAMLREAVGLIGGRLVTEASGNMTLGRIAEVAATGVDYISSGALTHSAPALDLGLDF